jgi:hypothetical protein
LQTSTGTEPRRRYRAIDSPRRRRRHEQQNGIFDNVASDFDADGNADLVVMEYDAVIRVLAGDGAGGFVAGASYAGGDFPLVGDYDGDGKVDLITAEANFGVMLHRDVSP